MAVLLADRFLGVRAHAAGADAHGHRSTASWGAVRGPWPGRAAQGADAPIGQPGGRTWVLALDPMAWPVRQGDLVVDVDGGLQWLVLSADLITNNADPSIDYVRIEAHDRTSTGTAP